MFASVRRILQSILAIPVKMVDCLTSKWVVVVGHSMHPTLRDGQRVRVLRNTWQPERWDIVFFEHPQREGFWEVKRVIGLPGETVQLDAGRLSIDGNALDEPFVEGIQPRMDRQWHLGDDEYILMGDNRRRSTDSRSFGPVRRQGIIGSVVLPSKHQ